MSQQPDVFGDAYKALIARGIKAYPGPHFQDPRLLLPMTVVSTSVQLYDSGNTVRTAATTAFFTGLASYGVQDQTDWTSNTYKTIYTHTGMGLIHGMIACTAGGAETTTFEITIDGVLREITVTNANTERALLWTGQERETDFTTTNNEVSNVTSSGLDSGTLTTLQTGAMWIPVMRHAYNFGCPLLRYDTSCLIRMKHSASITNSTATSYSGVMVRKGIAA